MEFVSEDRGQRMWPALPAASLKPEAGEISDAQLPEGQEVEESRLIKEEISCIVQLRMLREGKEIGGDEPPREYHELSQETKELQANRREKNRAAAKKCRLKKKTRTDRLKQNISSIESDNKEARAEILRYRQEFALLLRQFPTQACFKEFLRRHGAPLLKESAYRQILTTFADTEYHQLRRTACLHREN